MNIQRETREQKLTKLFEDGKLEEAGDDAAFLTRLNQMVIGKRPDVPANTPAEIADGIDRHGRLHPHHELYCFGHWLLLDQTNGFRDSRGHPIDRRRLLKSVGAGLDHLHMRDLATRYTDKLAEVETSPGEKAIPRPVPTARERSVSNLTKKDLSTRWNKLFGDKMKTSDFDAQLKSMKRVLPLYIGYIQSDPKTLCGKTLKRSPKIEALLHALKTPPKPSAKPIASPLKPPAEPLPAAREPFEIALQYSSDEQREEYRAIVEPDLAMPTLTYTPEEMTATSSEHEIAKSRKGRLVLQPAIEVRKSYRTEALLDRMVILLHTREITSHKSIQGKLQNATGASMKVVSWDASMHRKAWGCSFPRVSAPDPGRQFAILIQEPTPELLAQIVSTLETICGVIGDVRIHMIELSVDFYIRAMTQSEMLSMREKFVGALHRHHWVLPTLFLTDEPSDTRNIDPRQRFTDAQGDGKTRYLFAGTKRATDFDVFNPEIRDIILTSSSGERLHLNSTIYKGEQGSSCWVSIQHKIADERNELTGTKRDLEQSDRRARIEVTLSGRKRLSELGTVQDLASASFRQLGKRYLTFKLAAIAPLQHVLEDAKTQLSSRGVYGIELRHRAQAELERETAKKDGRTPPRISLADSVALTDWTEMNTCIGEALDALTRRWKRFSGT
ncbi:hypothetical protein GCM10011415_10510 [Salipiger pallidus]|uniref:Uncharacterized protein n=1 Tax=Salipiger pallidus TaxID=1775170 RepID=A0A8J3EFP3_9RHOB|nr:hypothetical protein [Salipiger pallidus]GGG65633.1 hypothetical protein GCM10011415_10510 [Salipiger pallidus]